LRKWLLSPFVALLVESWAENAWERQLLSWHALKQAGVHTESTENTEEKLAKYSVLPENEKTCRTKVRRSQKTGGHTEGTEKTMNPCHT